jgi:hypothetical protein
MCEYLSILLLKKNTCQSFMETKADVVSVSDLKTGNEPLFVMHRNSEE